MIEASTTPPGGVVRSCGVQFRTAGTIHTFDAVNLDLRRGERVVVETERGLALGVVIVPPGEPFEARGQRPLRILKKADERDFAAEDASRLRERETQRVASELIRNRRLPMKLVRTELSLDQSRLTVYFFAENRVDFRELVRDLAQRLRTRVEMKQIGARDETKLVGGVGPCGRELCCSSWLREFHAVSVKMAKEQDLSLNPSKLAGMCGRLKCCLRYEYETYLELKRELPRVGAKVTCVKGDGQVVRQIPLRQTVIVRREEDGLEVEATLEDLVLPKGPPR